MDFENEISRVPPAGVQIREYKEGQPILYAFDCVLLEGETDTNFVYTAINLTTNRKRTLHRSVYPLSPSGLNKMVERIKKSPVAGYGKFELDRPSGEQIGVDKAYIILNHIFKTILPKYGYNIRNEQIDLAVHILTSIRTRKFSLSEAEVGTGKTHAYLVASIIIKRGRLNDFWNKDYYPKMQYADMSQMPIVIATSSIALQKAIISEYIPELSRILLENGIIKTPLTAALQKGKENYICEKNLWNYVEFENNEVVHQTLKVLAEPTASIDMAEAGDKLTPYVKRKICVPKKCFDFCRHKEDCQYLEFRKGTRSPKIDIQVCNHNYLFADTILRTEGTFSLIPNYQMLIIDEAHKLLSAIRTMYGIEFSSQSLPILIQTIAELNFKNGLMQKIIHRGLGKLSDENKSLFKEIIKKSDDSNDEAERYSVEIDVDTVRHLRNIRDISDSLIELISSETLAGYGTELKTQVLWDLEQYRDQAAALVKPSKLICWLEIGNNENRLCGIPKDLDKRLFLDQWSKGIPTTFTSGTLSAKTGMSGESDFSHIKKTLGLEMLKDNITEINKQSPFNHKENALLYISENMPFPNNKSSIYIKAIAEEIKALIIASHGHAAVLFTSYKVMDKVWEQLLKYKLPFPMFRLDKGGVLEIERFKESNGGVLFASGALWEGIDIPGDALSMLIIVKLPFQVPDPISEYEQTLYKNMTEYKSRVVVPEMLMKLKQGFGRLIRKETDTGVVAILDSRTNKTGAYRQYVLNALPDCNITDDICDVRNFIKNKKSDEYFKI